MRRREAEDLALQEIEDPDLVATVRSELSPTPLSELREAAADRAMTFMSSQISPPISCRVPTDYYALRSRARGRDRDTSRER